MLDTNIPRRGITVTNWSRTRRCSASRIGVRPMPELTLQLVLADDGAGRQIEPDDHPADLLVGLLAQGSIRS